MTWPAVRLKYLAQIKVSTVDKKAVDGQAPVRLCNYTDVYYRDAISSDQDFMDATATSEQIANFTLREDDVIITKDSESPDDIGIPAYVEKSAPDLLCGYHLAILRPNPDSLDGRYLFWAMSSAVVRSQLGSRATGVTRFGLRSDVIANTLIRVPPLDEQRNIARYLDGQTSRIAELTGHLDVYRSLLGEHRQSLVTAAMEGPVRETRHGDVPARK